MCLPIMRFKSLIMNEKATKILDEFQMTTSELARLCVRRLLSSDHVSWICNQLNHQQSNTWCIYLNFVRDISTFVSQKLSKSHVLPQNLCFVINVGKSGKTCFVGSDSQPGCHWTVLFYSRSNHTLTYGDSMGWPFPDRVSVLLQTFVDCIWINSPALPTMEFCHDVGTHENGARKCSDLCTHYPYQTCSNVCGVVALVMAAIFCLRDEFFYYLTLHKKSSSIPSSFISSPTRYNKYLRRVLISWFSSGNIDIGFVSPRTIIPTDTSAVFSDSEEELDVPRVNIDEIQSGQTEDNSMHAEKQANQNVITCPTCKLTFSKLFNLRRHVTRKHDGNQEIIASYNTGQKTLCLECGRRFRRTMELTKHLEEDHQKVFQSEVITFSNQKGSHSYMCIIFTLDNIFLQ